RKKWCWIDVLLFLPFFPLIYFLEEIWDDMACDSAFLFSHSLGFMISLMIFAIVLFFLNTRIVKLNLLFSLFGINSL
ncbi:hypothetical protein, partial [Enterococcus faecium]|uniref:hypothetical protein n=6 Tax=Enterococcus TaxID=1350 RepID=UPI0006471F51